MSRWGKVKAKVSAISDATYWTELKTDEGDVYYYNTHTEETSWERPAAMDLQHASVEETKSNGMEVHTITGDLKPLQKFRNKKTYDNRNHDHLKFKTTQAALLGHEQVKFSDFVYRIVPPQHGKPLSIEPARLMITSHAVYDFDIGQAEGHRLKPQRRLPLLAIKQIGIHQKHPTIFFRLNSEKQRHAIRYYNPRKDMIVNLMLRTYAVSTKLGLRKKFVTDDIPDSIKKLSNDTKKLLAKGNGGLFGLVGQAQAVAAFRGGLVTSKQTKCNYCQLDTTGDSGARRHGDYVYHLECDPRERATMREEANAAIAKGKKPKVEKVSGTMAEARAKILADRSKREEEAQKARDEQIAEIEKEQKKMEYDRQREIARRVAAQEAKLAEYEERKAAVEGKLKCGGCSNTFTGGDYFNVLGAIWHPECFVCQECGCSFGNYGYFVRKSEIHKGVKTLLPYCYDHSETSWMGKKLLWLADYSANLRRKLCCKEPVNWSENRNTLMSQKTSSSGGGYGDSGGADIIHYYWVDEGNNLQGPIGANQLMSLETEGIVDDDTMCIREGDDEYTSYSNLRSELKSAKEQKSQSKKIHKKQKSMAAGEYHLGDMTQEWYYVDPESNALCGPYKASEFVEWQKNGDLHGDMQVIRSGEENYSSLHTRQRTLMNDSSMGSMGSTLMANPLNVAKAKGGKKWKVGDSCDAPFADYGDYPAKIIKISGKNAIVIFDGYEDEETVPLSSLS